MKEEKKDKYREKFNFKRVQFVATKNETNKLGQILSRLSELFKSLPEVQNSRKFVSYIPLKNEADVSLINDYLKNTGKKLLCILPKVPAPIPLDLRFQIIITPILAFDRRGNRLGQGGGWYDKFIAKTEEVCPDVVKIGIAFAMQEMADVPMGKYDKKMDIIITENEIKEDGQSDCFG